MHELRTLEPNLQGGDIPNCTGIFSCKLKRTRKH